MASTKFAASFDVLPLSTKLMGVIMPFNENAGVMVMLINQLKKNARVRREDVIE